MDLKTSGMKQLSQVVRFEGSTQGNQPPGLEALDI